MPLAERKAAVPCGKNRGSASDPSVELIGVHAGLGYRRKAGRKMLPRFGYWRPRILPADRSSLRTHEAVAMINAQRDWINVGHRSFTQWASPIATPELSDRNSCLRLLIPLQPTGLRLGFQPRGNRFFLKCNAITKASLSEFDWPFEEMPGNCNDNDCSHKAKKSFQ